MTLRMNGSTSGYTEIDAPAVAGNNTLLLPGGNGTANQALVTNGSGTLSFADRGRMVLETAKAYNWNGSSSNTTLDFTSIPSWVKRVTVMFNGVSTSGTSLKLVQIGSGSVTTTGYVSASAAISGGTGFSVASSTAGFVINSGEAADSLIGTMTIYLLSGNTYVSSQSLGDTLGTYVNAYTGGGNVTLSGTLDRVRITTVNDTDTFDAGSFNILYEG